MTQPPHETLGPDRTHDGWERAAQGMTPGGGWAMAIAVVTLAAVAAATLLWLASRRRVPVAGAVGALGVAGQVLRGAWRPVGMPLGW